MLGLRLDSLRDAVAEKVRPFFEDVLGGYQDNVHSIHVVGSALTGDFDEKTSDINSIFVLREMDVKFLEVLAPKGKKYRKRKVSAPLIMTPGYIQESTDVFPVEFLSFKLIHEAVYGEDILRDIEIRPRDLRHQCEREIKTKLIGLRQGYISSLGDAAAIAQELASSITGHVPLLRGIVMLKGHAPPVLHDDVITALGDATGVDCGAFRKVLEEKRRKVKLSKDEADRLFEDYYAATESLGKAVDEIQA